MPQSERYNNWEMPTIRSDIMVTPLVFELALGEIRKQFISNGNIRVVDIGAGNGILANLLLFNSELENMEIVEPSCSIYSGIFLNQYLNQDYLQSDQEPKILIPWKKSAVEFLETMPDNTLAIVILCMVTLHFSAQELIDVMDLVSNKINKNGSVIIADIHSSRFDPIDSGKIKEVTLPTTNSDQNFELKYYPRSFEKILEPLKSNSFENEISIIPSLEVLKIHILREKYPQIFDDMKPEETPYQISLLRKILHN